MTIATTVPSPFAPVAAEHARPLNRWLRTCTQPHPQLGRPGSVCPFIKPILQASSLRAFTYRISDQDEVTAETIAAMLPRAREVFTELAWPTTRRSLQVLMILLPGLDHEQWHLIDEAHTQAKGSFVRNGLMLGQFHPACPEPAAHNPDLPINRSPIPLYAVRYMQLHDIVFLHRNPAWFAAYDQRFGRLYARGGRAVNDTYATLYRKARTRYMPVGRRS